MRGFGVRFTPTQTAFVIQWREPTGAKPRRTLRPRWPQLKSTDARELARKQLGEVVAAQATGGDQPMRVALRDWFERESERKQWRPRYRFKVDRIIAVYIEGVDGARVKLTPTAKQAIKEIGGLPIRSVTRTHVLRIADNIKRGAADQFLAILSSFFNDMYDREVVQSNPARNRIKVTGGRRIRNRAFTGAELVTLWRSFEEEGDPAFGAFELLVYTGARRAEVTEMRWSEIDLEAATWTLPPERRKTGKKDLEPFVIHLAPAAVKVIARQPRLEGSPFVFWGRRDHRPFDFHHALVDRLRDSVKLPDWRLHDVRRTVRTGMGRLGVSQVVAELCLGHLAARPGLVAVYDVHTYADEKRAAWCKWAAHVQRLLS